MKPKHLYFALCVPGAVLPYTQLVPWLLEGNRSLVALFSAPFASHATALFGFDLMVAAVTFLVWLLVEAARQKVRLWWLALVATFAVGLSLGLPLYLYLRERDYAAGN